VQQWELQIAGILKHVQNQLTIIKKEKKMATTPWGKSDHAQKVARGIMWYSTPSHGGYHLSKGRLKSMPDPYRSFQPWAGEGWYEEDCDWALVILSFPEEFKQYFGEEKYTEIHVAAYNTIEMYKDYFKVSN
jgi:hypothetical protein